MRYYQIKEARRNPEINKKTYAYEALKKYEGSGYFASFTADVGSLSHGGDSNKKTPFAKGAMHNAKGSKIGINPMSSYNTPIGVYAYPIDYVISKNLRVEFAAKEPYIQVIKINTDKILYVNQVTEKLFETVRKKLQEWYPDFEYTMRKEFSPNELSYMINACAKHISSENSGRTFAHLLRKLGYEVIVDYDPSTGNGIGFVHSNEPTQAVFLTPSSYKLVETIHNIQQHKDYKTVEEFVAGAKQGNMQVNGKMFSFMDSNYNQLPSDILDHIVRRADKFNMKKIAKYFEKNQISITEYDMSPQTFNKILSYISPEYKLPIICRKIDVEISEDNMMDAISGYKNDGSSLPASGLSLLEKYPKMASELLEIFKSNMQQSSIDYFLKKMK